MGLARWIKLPRRVRLIALALLSLAMIAIGYYDLPRLDYINQRALFVGIPAALYLVYSALHDP
jgi:hypothetical protein